LLANPPAYMAGAKTVSECEFLVWDHGTIRRLAKAYPQLTENGLRLALHYLNVYMNRHASIVTKSAEFKTRRSTAASRHRSGEGAAVGSGNRHHQQTAQFPLRHQPLVARVSEHSAFLQRRIYSFLIAPAQRQHLSARVIVLPNRFSTASL
jgi:hypothetical protein